MAIEEMTRVEIARVEVNDEFRVELAQVRKVTDYTPSQARQLARELGFAAYEAEVMRREKVKIHAYEGPTAPNGERVL